MNEKVGKRAVNAKDERKKEKSSNKVARPKSSIPQKNSSRSLQSLKSNNEDPKIAAEISDKELRRQRRRDRREERRKRREERKSRRELGRAKRKESKLSKASDDHLNKISLLNVPGQDEPQLINSKDNLQIPETVPMPFSVSSNTKVAKAYTDHCVRQETAMSKTWATFTSKLVSRGREPENRLLWTPPDLLQEDSHLPSQTIFKIDSDLSDIDYEDPDLETALVEANVVPSAEDEIRSAAEQIGIQCVKSSHLTPPPTRSEFHEGPEIQKAEIVKTGPLRGKDLPQNWLAKICAALTCSDEAQEDDGVVETPTCLKKQKRETFMKWLDEEGILNLISKGFLSLFLGKPKDPSEASKALLHATGFGYLNEKKQLEKMHMMEEMNRLEEENDKLRKEIDLLSSSFTPLRKACPEKAKISSRGRRKKSNEGRQLKFENVEEETKEEEIKFENEEGPEVVGEEKFEIIQKPDVKVQIENI